MGLCEEGKDVEQVVEYMGQGVCAYYGVLRVLLIRVGIQSPFKLLRVSMSSWNVFYQSGQWHWTWWKNSNRLQELPKIIWYFAEWFLLKVG